MRAIRVSPIMVCVCAISLILAGHSFAEIDPATRKAYYDELQTIFIEQTPFTPIYHEVTLYAAQKNVGGLSLDPNFNPSLATVYKTIE